MKTDMFKEKYFGQNVKKDKNLFNKGIRNKLGLLRPGYLGLRSGLFCVWKRVRILACFSVLNYVKLEFYPVLVY